MTRYVLYLGDCLDWMDQRAANSIQAIVTDPPYGLKEYTSEEKAKLRSGNGGCGVFHLRSTVASAVGCPGSRF